MKKSVLALLFLGLILTACGEKAEAPASGGADNPFFSEYGTPFETPPFDKIKEEHYMPAFMEGMKRQKAEVAAIVENTAEPTFANTIETLERSGGLLGKVSLLFFNMNSAHTNETIQTIAQEVAPLLSKHQDDIALNADLFQRVKAVYERRADLDLDAEQARLLETAYKAFVRGGANLGEAEKARFRRINEELSVLSLKFGENVLKETNAFELVIDQDEDLAGLPQAVITGAAETAAERGHEGKWVFTIQKPSMLPFLQYSERRELREQIFKAYISVGDNGNEFDNKANAARLAALRVERANLLGYPTHAHYVLEENMAKVPENVYKLLDQLWEPALRMAKKEAAQLQAKIDEEGGGFKLEPWDWWYYAEKVKKAKYALDDEILRPYFKLENVIDGAFGVATRLWGLQFKERPDIAVYHPDVKCFEVQEADGTHIGILYADYFPRASKRGGAWMNNFREQSKVGGEKITPIVYNVGNFSKPTADRPSLVTFEEALTLFHEFGHALHGLLSDCTYESLAGTNVPWDFVELPSQIMEHWASHPDYLKEYARHYETSEPIPQELIDKMEKAGTFNQGFSSTEYLAASYLDMDWHTLMETKEVDPAAFEEKSLSRIGLIPEIVVRYRTPYFRHIFAGGYSAGYYSYDWSAVLDSDAFEAFTETSLFDQEKARALRKYIFSAGNADDPMTMFKNFRGREPRPEALLRKRGFLE